MYEGTSFLKLIHSDNQDSEFNAERSTHLESNFASTVPSINDLEGCEVDEMTNTTPNIVFCVIVLCVMSLS